MYCEAFLSLSCFVLENLSMHLRVDACCFTKVPVSGTCVHLQEHHATPLCAFSNGGMFLLKLIAPMTLQLSIAYAGDTAQLHVF